jgi:PAS domain S-box-containing protein
VAVAARFPRSHEELLRAIAEQAPDAIVYADRQGVIRFWNGAAERIFGRAAADAVGLSLDIIIPERLRTAHWNGFRSAVGTGRTKYDGQSLTTRAVHSDGRKLYVELSFSLLRDDRGTVCGVVATARDCTERYLAEREHQPVR